MTQQQQQAARWIEDAFGLAIDGGDIGGDVQLGDAYSRRFTASHTVTFGPTFAPRLPLSYTPGTQLHLVVTVYWYPVETSDGRISVERQIEHLLCTDHEQPGQTEVWGDYTYETGLTWYDDITAAQNTCRQLGEQFDPHGEIAWAGDLTLTLPDWPDES